MNSKFFLILLVLVMVLVGCNKTVPVLEEFTPDMEIWELKTEINQPYYEEVYTFYIEKGNPTSEELEEWRNLLNAKKEKLGFDILDENTKSTLEVQIKDRKIHDIWSHTLQGYSEGVLTINEHTFPFEGDVDMWQFLHEEQVYYFASFNTYIESLLGEEEIFALMMAWNISTGETHGQVTVGFGNEPGLLIFGEKFDVMFHVEEEELIPW